jgi:hypothetical protein
MKTGYLRYDDAANDYVVPAEELDEFETFTAAMEYYRENDELYDELKEEFDSRFKRRRLLDGELFDMEIIYDD